MGVDSVKVLFNKLDRCYYSGDTMTVQIEIASISGFRLNEISCRIQGQAKTQWKKTSGKTTYYYKGSQTYFDTKIILFKKPYAEAAKLPPGRNTYKFSFDVPYGIPPSFNGSRLGRLGCIIYHIDVTIDIPWKFNETIQEPFRVKSLFDLNQYPSLREPAGTIMENNLWCCFNSGEISAVVRVPYKGYVVGQNIPVTVQIENCSNLHINDIFVDMRKITTFYTAGRKHSSEDVEIVKEQQSLGVRVKAGDTYAFCFNYVVPNVTVVNMMDCSIIDYKYELYFNLKLPALTCNMRGQLPIIVGLLPFDNVQSADEPSPYELLELII